LKDFTEFKKAFLPAFEMVKDRQTTFEQIVFSEFPKHKKAIATLLHIYPLVWYRRLYFTKKWDEYEKAYNDLKDFLSKSTFPEGLLKLDKKENKKT